MTIFAGTDNVAGGRPVVSIIVPMADDDLDGQQRLANARAQSWPRCEIVAVYTRAENVPSGAVRVPNGNLAAALNAGVAACHGDHVSLLLPGSRYDPKKISRQIEFMEQFELGEAIIFCDYRIRRDGQSVPELVALPSLDPATMFRHLYCGFPLLPSTLLVPHAAFDEAGPLNEHTPQTALYEFCLKLSTCRFFVGLAEPLVEAERRSTSRNARSNWRRMYPTYLPRLLGTQGVKSIGRDRLALLGHATAMRLAEGLPGAAWDVARVMARELKVQPNKRLALTSYIKPLVRRAGRRLPSGIKKSVRALLRSRSPAAVNPNLDFSAIYRDNGFAGTESISGSGSTLFQTRIIRRQLPLLFRQLGVRSILDIPCGDLHWMRDVDLGDIHYTGADVVPELIDANKREFASPARDFACVDLMTGPLPAADLIFCRDCLVHLPFSAALAALDVIRKTQSQWLLTTTFTEHRENKELDSAGWRALNLELPPFNLSAPQMVINEKCTEDGGRAGDKALALWRIADLRGSGSGG